jgi:hypothetical protein
MHAWVACVKCTHASVERQMKCHKPHLNPFVWFYIFFLVVVNKKKMWLIVVF